MIEEPIVEGKFIELLELATGASKLNLMSAVPATAPTVTPHETDKEVGAFHEQMTAVPLVQTVLVHRTGESARVAVKSWTPKFSPVTVCDAIPEVGRFFDSDDRTGASKVKTDDSVPIAAPTVVVEMCIGAASEAERHDVDVADVQAAVPHAAAESDSVALK